MVARIGIGDAYGIEGADADDLPSRWGHHDAERDVFPSISWLFCFDAKQESPARGRSSALLLMSMLKYPINGKW